MLKLIFGLLSVLAASFSVPCFAEEPAATPAAYTASVGVMRQNKFCENDIKSFVHRVFGMYDKHVPVEQFLPLLRDGGLEMVFPEVTLRSHADFRKWYANVGKNFESNTHTLERVDVTFPGGGRYGVDLTVFWQALGRDGKYVSFRAHQVWTLDNGTDGKSPRILRYLVN